MKKIKTKTRVKINIEGLNTEGYLTEIESYKQSKKELDRYKPIKW